MPIDGMNLPDFNDDKAITYSSFIDKLVVPRLIPLTNLELQILFPVCEKLERILDNNCNSYDLIHNVSWESFTHEYIERTHNIFCTHILEKMNVLNLQV